MFYDTKRFKTITQQIDLHDWIFLSHDERDEIERRVDFEMQLEESLRHENELKEKHEDELKEK